MKSGIRSLALGAALLLAPGLAHAFDEGIANGGTSCSPCHGSASGSVSVSITGPSVLAPSASATYTAAITNAGVGAGVDVAIDSGSLTAIDANTKLLSGEVVHSNAKDMTAPTNFGDWSYDFQVTAPATMGTINLFAALNAFNGDGSPSGDLWNTTTFAINVVPEPGTALLLMAGLGGLAAVGRRRSAGA